MGSNSKSQASDWDALETVGDGDPKAIIWASRGGDGSGKSYFACTAPGPIYVAGFDPSGLDRVDKTVRAQREIRRGRYGFNASVFDGDRAKVMKEAERVWAKFKTDYRDALKHCRTAVWDREDLAWELIRFVNFGAEKNEGSRTGALDYGDLNAEYVGLVQEARDAGVNLGLLQGVKNKWVAKFDPMKSKMVNYDTGEQVPDGFKKIADHVDITLDHFWDDKERVYKVRFMKFPNALEKGNAHPNIDFPLMASTAFPDADLALWVN